MKDLSKARREVREKLKKDLSTRDNEGRSIINIMVNDKDDILSPISDEDGAVINGDFSQFLSNKVKFHSPKSQLHLKITTKNDLEDKDKKNIALAIKNHYENEFMESERERKKGSIVALIMFAIGLALLAISFGLAFTVTPMLVIEVIEIAGWVFEWECVDILSFRRTKIVFSQRRYLSLMKSKVSFEKVNDGKKKSEQKTTRQPKNKSV